MAYTLPWQKGQVPGACCLPSSFSFSSHTHASHIILRLSLCLPFSSAARGGSRRRFLRPADRFRPESEMRGKIGIAESEGEREKGENSVTWSEGHFFNNMEKKVGAAIYRRGSWLLEWKIGFWMILFVLFGGFFFWKIFSVSRPFCCCCCFVFIFHFDLAILKFKKKNCFCPLKTSFRLLLVSFLIF